MTEIDNQIDNNLPRLTEADKLIMKYNKTTHENSTR